MVQSGYEGVAVLVSERGHYSIGKAIDLLGFGRNNLIAIPVDDQHKIRLDLLEQKCEELASRNIKVMALIGIAGTTETGNIDPLSAMADIAKHFGIFFHVDAAWGGASLMSRRGAQLMSGIEKADSVTIDAHKQMYVPIGAGMVVFKDPKPLIRFGITQNTSYASDLKILVAIRLKAVGPVLRCWCTPAYILLGDKVTSNLLTVA